jgi:GNAT superfamily N-acetyltransferase
MMKISLSEATADDVAAIVAIKNQAAQQLTSLYGKGHWSYQCTDKGIQYEMKGNSKLLIAKYNNVIVGTLNLVTKKPWAIDVTYFTRVQQPIYLIGMAVHPDWQRNGIGSHMLQQVKAFVVAWPAQAIRLDAYDNPAGAGEFYRKCGYKERGRVVYKSNPLIYFELLV